MGKRKTQTRSLKRSVNEDIILPPPERFRDGYNSIPKPRTDRPLQMQNARRPPKPSRKPPLEKCKIIVQSVKIPTGKGRLYLTKDTVSRKNCIVTVKNDDTICLARAIVTAHANLKPERWSKTQLKNGFNSSRKLQRLQAMELHEEANVEINDYDRNQHNRC